MAKKRKGRKGDGSALTKVDEVAAATVGLAAAAYKATQAYRDGGEEKAQQGGGPRRPKRAVPLTSGGAAGQDGQALTAHTPAAGDETAPAAELAPPDASPSRLTAVGGDSGHPLGVAGAVAGAVGVAKALLDLNAAPPDALMTLRKIGRKRAKRIVAHRPFLRVKDLKRVLPKRVYEVVKHQLTV